VSTIRNFSPVTAKLHAKYAKSPTFFEYVTYPAEHSLTQMRTDHSLAPAKFETLRYKLGDCKAVFVPVL
jgi:hypothetical protein